MTRKLFVLMMIAALLLANCAPAAPTPAATPQLPMQGSGDAAQSPVYPGADWAFVDDPESIGWSSTKLAVAQAYAKRIGSAAVMVVDDGVVVAAWGDVTHKYFCHSMRKSLMSALYGIYVAEGKIDLTATLKDLGIDDKTPLTEIEKTATVKDLLSARSGVYIEAAGEAASMKAMRPARGSHAPGTFWYYNNWDFNTLGTIFDQLSGEKNIYTAFDKRIADPIGMQDYDPAEFHYTYEPYSEHPYYGFRLSARLGPLWPALPAQRALGRPAGRSGGLGPGEHDPPLRHRPTERLRLHVVDGRGLFPQRGFRPGQLSRLGRLRARDYRDALAQPGRCPPRKLGRRRFGGRDEHRHIAVADPRCWRGGGHWGPASARARGGNAAYGRHAAAGADGMHAHWHGGRP
jgi:CubicO group peptidase (beta-lactamase class C family)